MDGWMDGWMDRWIDLVYMYESYITIEVILEALPWGAEKHPCTSWPGHAGAQGFKPEILMVSRCQTSRIISLVNGEEI